MQKSFTCAFLGCERTKDHAVQCCSKHQPIKMGKDGHEAERYALSIMKGRDMGVDAYELAVEEAEFDAFPNENAQEQFEAAAEQYERHESEYGNVSMRYKP